MTGAEPEAAAHAAEEAGASFDAGGMILHHILDAREIEIPFTGAVVQLPRIEIGGLDLSITRTVVMMWIACLILVILLGLAARRAKEPVPRGIRSALEILILFVRDEIGRKSIGPKADRVVGYLLTTFFFILTCNLLGLVPGMSTATGNISVTAGLAVVAFVMIHTGGVREHGVFGHFRNLVPHGVPLWLVPILLLVELLSMVIKPFALCIRLFANMMAGHVVILALISLVFILKIVWVAPLSVLFALFINLLEILVAFIQAYIFTMLTAQFIGMAVHPAH